jgi:hypothetical protein
MNVIMAKRRMTQLRDIEKEHNETILEQSTQLLEAYSKGQLEDELPDGLKIVRHHQTHVC